MITTTAPAGTPTALELAHLAESVVADGFAAHCDAVDGLVVNARWSGVSEVLLDVLADADAPTVARERALGLVLVALDTPSAQATPTAPTAATLTAALTAATLTATRTAATLTAKGEFADDRRPTVDASEFADDRRPTPVAADRPLVAH